MRDYNDWIYQEGLGSNEAYNIILDLLDAALYDLYDCGTDDLPNDLIVLLVSRIRNSIIENAFNEGVRILMELSNYEQKRE